MATPIFIVDAFADRPLTGNPAAVCPLEAWLPDPLMQAIAAEMNLSETVFFVPEGEGYRIRWFTPTTEVDLVGHATLAAAFIVLERLERSAERVRFDSQSGPLTVSKGEGGLLLMDLPARAPAPIAGEEAERLARALGRRPAETLAARHYLAVYAEADEVRALAPDMAGLAALPRPAAIVTAPADDSVLGHDFVSRFFAPANGVPEDPVSGVAHCTLVPYWAARLKRDRLSGRQLSRRGGTLVCRALGERVEIGGGALLALEGMLAVP